MEGERPAHICRFRPVVFMLGPSQGKRVLKNTDNIRYCSFFSPTPRDTQTYGRHFPPAASAVSLTKERAATTHPPVAAVTILYDIISTQILLLNSKYNIIDTCTRR